jgi:hypothetical protein
VLFPKRKTPHVIGVFSNFNYSLEGKSGRDISQFLDDLFGDKNFWWSSLASHSSQDQHYNGGARTNFFYSVPTAGVEYHPLNGDAQPNFLKDCAHGRSRIPSPQWGRTN